MTAAELIDLLASHPKSCERLKILLARTAAHQLARNGQITLWDYSPTYIIDAFRHLLIGAGAEYLTDRGIGLPEWVGDGWRCYRRGVAVPCSEESQPTMLHALLAAIEETP